MLSTNSNDTYIDEWSCQCCKVIYLHEPPDEIFCIQICASLVSVPDPKPIPARIAFSIAHVFPYVILEAIYAPDEVWGRD